MLRKIRNGFFAGLILIAPLGVTLFVVNFMLTRIGRPVNEMVFRFVGEDIRTLPGISIALDLLALLILVVVITLLGFLSNYFIGRFFITIGEKMIDRLPFVNTVYKTVKQIVDTFSKQQKAVFQKVVMTEYPRKGVWVIGFLTSEAKGEIQERTGEDVVNVFVPTTPNPTSGFLLIVPRKEIKEMEMTVAEGMKVIVSGGAVIPPYPRAAAPANALTGNGAAEKSAAPNA